MRNGNCASVLAELSCVMPRVSRQPLNFIGRLIRPFINRRAKLFGLDLGA